MSVVRPGVAILGIYVADLAFRAGRLPLIGETIIGSAFQSGPGGKGSNQAVAVARAGARVTFISRLGRDEFGATARALWAREGIALVVGEDERAGTGAAFIYIDEANGENAIIVVPGAASGISISDVDAGAAAIASAGVFVTQLEQPIEAAMHGLKIARQAGTITIFNPAPAASVPAAMFELSDYLTPNETEASQLSGIEVKTLDDARRAGDVFLQRGVGTALITLGAAGALFHTRGFSQPVPAFNAGPAVDTAGAGDAFNGGFAAALSAGMMPYAAARFASAAAGLSVTRPGTAPSMPVLKEIEALIERQR